MPNKGGGIMNQSKVEKAKLELREIHNHLCNTFCRLQPYAETIPTILSAYEELEKELTVVKNDFNLPENAINEVKNTIRKKGKVAAIRLCRSYVGSVLTAKEIVDAIIAGQEGK